MWSNTEASRRLGITYPIIQGPFGGGLSSTKLTATVSNAGGLGSYGADHLGRSQILGLVGELHKMTDKPFAVNLWVPCKNDATFDSDVITRSLARLQPYYWSLGIKPPEVPASVGQTFEHQIEAILEARPPVFSFVYGVPDPWILKECQQAGIRTIGTATSVDEASALDAAGVDCIVASGYEAGGHKAAFLRPPEESLTGTFALIPQIVDWVSAPVIGAGGIADGRGVKAALALGAQGVQIGTAFLACVESGASHAYRDLLFSDEAADTVLTRVFTGRLARSMRNTLSEDPALAQELRGYPLQAWIMNSLKSAALAQGRTDLVSLWAGQGAPLIKHQRADELFQDLIDTVSI